MYKVFIPVAGTGSRLGGTCRYLNKSLVSVGNRPTICHIIEKFPREVVFVVALGYKGELVREFLALAYPERKIEFVTVSPFEGPGSGLGVSVLACRDLLQCPFVFCSCDTIVEEPIPEPTSNWLGCAERNETDQYRTLAIAGGRVVSILEKGAADASAHVYIGLAGVSDYKAFWSSMSEGDPEVAASTGESHGLRGVLNSPVRPMIFTWHDTGSLSGLEAARKAIKGPIDANILPKANEDIWFVGDSVIKFSADDKFIRDRVKRVEHLQGFCPEIKGHGRNMYRYKMAEGEVLSKVVTLPLFEKLLAECERFWEPVELGGNERAQFVSTCMDFYRDKTYQRVNQFHETFSVLDSEECVNGVELPTTKALLDALDWSWIASGKPTRFHGDFHFENILYSEKRNQFTFLDWRQNFGGLMHAGDIYYDLAKLNHGLIVCHELIHREEFSVVREGRFVRFELARKQSLVQSERRFEMFLNDRGFDARKVRVMTALIYLNIAALHHFPYCLLLYYLGKSMLAAEITSTNVRK